MRNGAAAELRRARTATALAAGIALLATASSAGSATAAPAAAGTIAAGRAIALAPDKGSCVSCHTFAGAEQAGDVGPVLHDLRRRFPDPALLRARIRDARDFNPDTLMPPYGTHRLLTGEEIESLVQFLYSL